MKISMGSMVTIIMWVLESIKWPRRMPRNKVFREFMTIRIFINNLEIDSPVIKDQFQEELI